MGKKFLSVFMSVALAVGLCPGLAYAHPTEYAAGAIAALDADDTGYEVAETIAVGRASDLQHWYEPEEYINETREYTSAASAPYGLAVTFSDDTVLYGNDYIAVAVEADEEGNESWRWYEMDELAGQTVIVRNTDKVSIRLRAYGDNGSSDQRYGYRVVSVAPLAQYDLRACSVSVSSWNVYYGKALEPNVSVRAYADDDSGWGEYLEEGVDYTVSYENNNAIGTGKAIVTGMGNYAGSTVTQSFSILDPYDVGNSWLEESRYFESATPYVPDLELTIDDKLVPSDGYSVVKCEYYDSEDYEYITVPGITAAGEYKLTLQGKSPYKGTVEHYVDVYSAYNLNGAKCSVPSLLFVGSESRPAPVVTLNGKSLVEGRDYSVAYYVDNDEEGDDGSTPLSSIVDEGDYLAVVSGISPYFGSARSYFSVGKPTDASQGDLDADDLLYTGKPTAPSLSWEYYDHSTSGHYELALMPGVNCTATYYTESWETSEDGSSVPVRTKLASAPTEPGGYYVEVAINGLAGTVEDWYRIYDPRDLSGATVEARYTVYTDDSTANPILCVKIGDKVLAEGVDFKVEYYREYTSSTGEWAEEKLSAMPTAPGSYEVEIVGTGDESQGYYGTRWYGYSIVQPDVPSEPTVSKAAIAIPDQVYTGKAIEPAVTVKLGGRTLVEGTDYKIVGYRDNVNAGSAAKVLIEGQGYYRGYVEKSFSIVKPSPVPEKTPSADTKTPAPQKKDNPMKVKVAKTKSVKAKNLKKKAQTVKKAITVSKAEGAVTYSKVSKGSSKKLTINKSTGVITVKKNTKKGTYKINVKVSAAGKGVYKPASKTVQVKVKVK